MKNFCKKGLAVLFVLMMALTPLLGAAGESLLSQYTQQALDQGLQLDTTLAVGLGEGAGAYMSLLGEGLYEAVQKALDSLTITGHMAGGSQGGGMAGLEFALQGTQFLNGQVRMTPTQLEVVTSLLPGKTVALPLAALAGMKPEAALQLDEEMLTTLGESAGTYLGILMGWMESNPDMVTEKTDGIPQSELRDAAVSMETLRISGVQLKDLLVQLSAAFEKDVKLQEALHKLMQTTGADGSVAEKAKALAEKINALEPTQEELVLEVLLDAQEAPVEMNLTLNPMFAGNDTRLSAQYTRHTLDGVTHRLEGRVTGKEGGQGALKLRYDEYVNQDSKAKVQAVDLRLMMQESQDAAMGEVAFTSETSTVTQAGKETQDNIVTLSVEEKPASGEQSATVISQPMSMEVRSNSVTQGTGGADFTWEQTAHISVLGMEFLNLRINGKSAPYAPQDTSANQVVDLGAATQQEKDALLKELETAAYEALGQAVTLLPQELLTLLSGQ